MLLVFVFIFCDCFQGQRSHQCLRTIVKCFPPLNKAKYIIVIIISSLSHHYNLHSLREKPLLPIIASDLLCEERDHGQLGDKIEVIIPPSLILVNGKKRKRAESTLFMAI